MYCPFCKKHLDNEIFCPDCGAKLEDDTASKSGAGSIYFNLGDANAINGDVRVVDSRQIYDNSVHTTNTTNNVTNNTTNNTYDNRTTNNVVNVYQKSSNQILAENTKAFVEEVMRMMDSENGLNANGMLKAESFHQLTLLGMQLMIPKQEADRIIATAQQSKMLSAQARSQEQAVESRAQIIQQMRAMAPPMPDMPPMPQFNPQSVQLSQMQGFNPLTAFEKLGQQPAAAQAPSLKKNNGNN